MHKWAVGDRVEVPGRSYGLGRVVQVSPHYVSVLFDNGTEWAYALPVAGARIVLRPDQCELFPC